MIFPLFSPMIHPSRNLKKNAPGGAWMFKKSLVGILLALAATSLVPVFAQQIDYLQAKPLKNSVKTNVRPVKSGSLNVPLITWGGDIATIYADQKGIFKDEGLKVRLAAENNFSKQVEACLAGETPMIRGTMGMINAAAEAFKAKGLDLVVVYQMTWSDGGDAMVVRKVKRPRNLKNKTIALQLYGPHMDYAANILNSAKVSPSNVKFKWLQELTLPTFDTRGKVVDPVSAFIDDSSLDAVMCIIPDALNLTSGGTGGTGASGSVKGAKILLSSKTANRIIADVYAFRSDYFNQNKATVQKFVHSLMRAEEALQDLLKNKKNKPSEYQQLMSKSADLLLGAPQAVPDIEALLADCAFVGFNGNVRFFRGEGTTRNFKNLTREIQRSFVTMKLMDSRVDLKNANWDYNVLAKGLSPGKTAPKAKPRFDADKVEKKISVEPTSWAEEGTLFQIEINFEPNQSEFPTAKYAADFQKALEVSETYGGALIVVEGHSDPLSILRAKQKKKPSAEIAQMEQQAKNLSYKRSQSVRASFLAYCKNKNVVIDPSQFVSVGLGISTPKFNPPRTKEEWAANRRVVFRIKQVEAELDEFIPLD